MFKKQKNTENRALVAAHQSLLALWIINPYDCPPGDLTVDDYRVLLRCALIATNHNDYAIDKSHREWEYLFEKWDALRNFNGKRELNSWNTYGDVLTTLYEDWDTVGKSPYSYRCVAALIRMLPDMQPVTGAYFREDSKPSSEP